jgi:6-pyruvoyltetrahydropterin/6-carboxytetrahydropterin synthase
VYRISKCFRFSASHRLSGLPAGHKCGRLHGHNYEVWFVLQSERLDPVGMVRDYGDLPAARSAVEALDHCNLNEFIEQTTAECLAERFYREVKPAIPELVAVRVSETPATWAEYSE